MPTPTGHCPRRRTRGDGRVRVVVVGAGITGLAAAVALVDAGADVALVDAARRAGGKIVTEHVDGFVVEHGPDSFVSYRPAAAALADRFGLGGDIMSVTEPRIVFLRRDGEMIPLPDGMGMVLPTRLGPFVRTRLFTLPQKLRVGLDLVLPRYLGVEDMAIGRFLRHRLGTAVIERLADPLIGGIYGTSIEELSLDAVLPMLRSYEQGSRSLILASLASGQKTAKGPGSPFRTLRGGLGDLVDALMAHLRAQPGFSERLGVSAESLTTDDAGTSHLRLASGEVIRADVVILATPAPATASRCGPSSTPRPPSCQWGTAPKRSPSRLSGTASSTRTPAAPPAARPPDAPSPLASGRAAPPTGRS